MAYRFKKGLQYLMPTHFGVAAGPRQTSEGTRWKLPDERLKESYAITLDGVAAELDALLPEGFVLDGAPMLTVTLSYQTNIGWLAGRGYNMLGLTIPARYSRGSMTARGPFLLVLWENMAEPIITGREQLGYSKIFCELPSPVVQAGAVRCDASWMGHKFMEVEVAELASARPATVPNDQRQSGELTGVMHLRYVPQVGGNSGEAAIVEPVITPSEAVMEQVLEEKHGSGSLRFFPTTWHDMPTQHLIVEALRGLTLGRTGPVIYRRVRGSGDLLEHRSLLDVD